MMTRIPNLGESLYQNNRLGCGASKWQRLSAAQTKDKPMTIAIGLINSEDKRHPPIICLAADSQMTNGNVKRNDAIKISQLKFSDNSGCALVAQAGNADNANRAIEILIELAKAETLSNRRSVADLVQVAIAQVRSEIRKSQGFRSHKQLSEFISHNEQQFFLLIGHLFENEAFLYVADLGTGRANRQNSYYAAIGTGSDLGSYLLKEYCSQNMPVQSAYAATVYIIDEVKKHDTYCSGNTRVEFILDGHCFFIAPNLMEQYSNMVARFNIIAREQRIKLVNEFLGELGKNMET